MGDPIRTDMRLSGRQLVEAILRKANAGEFNPTTGRLIAGSDNAAYPKKIADIASDAKIEVLKAIVNRNSAFWLRRLTLTYPANSEDVAWRGPGSVMSEPALRMSFIEDTRFTVPLPIPWVNWRERHLRRYDTPVVVASSRFLAATEGDRLCLVPPPAAGIPIRISYVQVPERVDPDSETIDPDIPDWATALVVKKGALDLLAIEDAPSSALRREFELALEEAVKYSSSGTVDGPQFVTETHYDGW